MSPACHGSNDAISPVWWRRGCLRAGHRAHVRRIRSQKQKRDSRLTGTPTLPTPPRMRRRRDPEGSRPSLRTVTTPSAPKSHHKTNTFCPITTAHGTRQHKLEGAGHKADPFEYPINTVQVFRCAPFLGSPFVGVALGLMTINVRTPPVGTIERTWQFPVNFSLLRPGARPGAHIH